MEGGGEPRDRGPRQETEGDWARWWIWRGSEPYEDMTGPFYFREEDQGKVRCAFRVERKHLNGGGALHGGAMMTFADVCLFAISYPVRKARGDQDHHVTVSLNGEFVGPAVEGDLVEAVGEVVRAGGSLSFIRGLMSTSGKPVMSFSGVVKRVKSPKA